ncbi:hypothetical protein GLOIN_2v1766850 [Rhizophagus irregularis DAOM 181602=DAOM 197198]|uniref:Uncharacterized protein n=1 Tax=Rhizophagus irregularis (strain DAOM 181602 / DAOM 197198 / MUCL 43194) TaxID=747089 RepID=A0A2P4QLB3_RHIID|nr:hypothetical protein GLOIN_2v1766850 [Rhizophagus irregularis DAOM 181602=DAOM 197198]POG78378.1 hypothetical protein GLOIN_2v1766850 [Rhizophagus irregularis DAOM 181602=DAOM 197198]|eukprot:XP_025185244.1 hypothetical protein GLOIN_2v1766850 [Rhizophagus irregularis DAOM 181602=DAOM 197198]
MKYSSLESSQQDESNGSKIAFLGLILKEILITEYIKKNEATNTSVNMMNVSNILNNLKSNEIESYTSYTTSTILTTSLFHNYEISSISNNLSNEVELYLTSKTPTTSSFHSYEISNIKEKLIGLCEKEKKAKVKLSLSYGIVNLNNSRIMDVLGQSVKFYFEAKMKKYKSQITMSKEALETLKYLNVIVYIN